MIENFIAAMLLAGVFVFFAYRSQKKRERAAEQQFHMLMQSLDEKAKREGTFVASYSDSETR